MLDALGGFWELAIWTVALVVVLVAGVVWLAVKLILMVIRGVRERREP